MVPANFQSYAPTFFQSFFDEKHNLHFSFTHELKIKVTCILDSLNFTFGRRLFDIPSIFPLSLKKSKVYRVSTIILLNFYLDLNYTIIL